MAEYQPPGKLLFTKASISPTLPNGKSIHPEINRIKSTWLERRRENALKEYMPLHVYIDDTGKIYCNDNEKLYMCRALEKQGSISEVEVRVCYCLFMSIVRLPLFKCLLYKWVKALQLC